METPFTTSPNPNCLYLTPSLKAVLHKVRFTISRRQGLTCILGDIGLGKSTVMRFLHAEYDALDDVVAVLIPTPVFSSEFSMLKAICLDLGLAPRKSIYDQQRELQDFLFEQFAAEKNVVLFVDEAQRLTAKMLEVVRAMLNVETNTHKLIQIVLAGQLDLRDRLLEDKNKALYSRIFAPSLLHSLTFPETQEMIRFRCEYAGIEDPFPEATVERLYELTGGVPRTVLRVCALAHAMMDLAEVDHVPVELVESAAAEYALGKDAS